MKLTDEQLAVIQRHTDGYRINRERLVSYLEKHKTIKNEVFSYCTTVSKKAWGSRGYCSFLDEEPMYSAVDRDTFIRRIPFYFTQIPYGGDKRSGLSKIIPINRKKPLLPTEYEEFYQDLEWMYYTLGLTLDSIFNYTTDQMFAPAKPKEEQGYLFSGLSGSFLEERSMGSRECFSMWRHYLHLCQQLGWEDYLPERFITSYNQALEAAGLPPVIYRPLKDYVTYFTRDENSYVCRGNFPCDKNGSPILKWTTIRVVNPVSVEFSAEKSRCGELRINLGPKTIIHARDFYTDDDSIDDEVSEEDETLEDDEPLMWRQIYAGPQTMEFNNKALKDYRIVRGMTQSEVAEAIGASVRTYQKWERGDSIPDGHYLLRLMNWLQIEDVQSLIKYDDYADSTNKEVPYE